MYAYVIDYSSNFKSIPSLKYSPKSSLTAHHSVDRYLSYSRGVLYFLKDKKIFQPIGIFNIVRVEWAIPRRVTPAGAADEVLQFGLAYLLYYLPLF